MDTSGRGTVLRPHIALWLVALSPVVFALVTWSHAQPRNSPTDLIRYFSLPIIATELIVIAAALASGSGVPQRVRRLPGWLGAALASLAIIATGTIVFVAIEKQLGAFTTSFWFVHVAFALSISALVTNRWRADAETIWTVVVGGLLCYVAIATVFIAMAPANDAFEWMAFNLGAVNIRHTAPYSVIGFLVAIALGLFAADDRRAFAMGLAATLFMAFTMWSGTRAALPALAATLGLATILFPEFRKRRAWTLIGASILGGALLSLIPPSPTASFGLFNAVSRSRSATPDEISSGRAALWKATAIEISKRPLFGHGDSQLSRFIPDQPFNHPHNIVLQMLFQWGVVGATLFFAIMAILWRRVTRAARADPAGHLHAWLLVSAIGAMSMLEGSLYFPYPVMMVAFAFAVSDGLVRRTSKPTV